MKVKALSFWVRALFYVSVIIGAAGSVLGMISFTLSYYPLGASGHLFIAANLLLTARLIAFCWPDAPEQTEP